MPIWIFYVCDAPAQFRTLTMIVAGTRQSAQAKFNELRHAELFNPAFGQERKLDVAPKQNVYIAEVNHFDSFQFEG